MAVKILYFTAGAVPTTEEKADIAALESLVAPAYLIGVRAANANPSYGAGAEQTDMVAGSPPLTGVGEAYEETPVFDPDSALEGFATILDGQEIVIAGTGTFAFTVVDGAITDIVLTPEP